MSNNLGGKEQKAKEAGIAAILCALLALCRAELKINAHHTAGPRLILAAPDGRVIKEEIPWSDSLNPELKNAAYFFIHTVRVFSLLMALRRVFLVAKTKFSLFVGCFRKFDFCGVYAPFWSI